MYLNDRLSGKPATCVTKLLQGGRDRFGYPRSAASRLPGGQYQWPQLWVKEHVISKQQVSKGGDAVASYDTETRIGTGDTLLLPINTTQKNV